MSSFAEFAFLLLAPVLVAVPIARAQDIPPASQAPSSPKSHMVPAWKRFSYACDDDLKLVVRTRGNYARVYFKDKVYYMTQTRSADGVRFAEGPVVWWTVGSGGFLDDTTDPSNPTHLAKNCKLDADATAPAHASSSVSGTVSYLQRIAMPPDAELEVTLQDVSFADAPAVLLAEEKSRFGDRQVPIPFELKFDPSKIDPKHTYAVSAKIMVEGKVRFRTTEAYRVLTQGNPSKVDLILRQGSE